MKSTKRICLVCEKETVFHYKRSIGHSICQVCGNRFGIREDNVPAKLLYKKCNKLKDELLSSEKIISKLRKKLKSEKDKYQRYKTIVKKKSDN